MVGGGGGCLNVNLVIGFGPSLGLALWPRAKPINTQIKRLDCAESEVFLIINYHCDMENTCLCLSWCFQAILQVFRGCFKVIS